MSENDFSFAKSRRFAPLFSTQFLGAFNDNLFKTTLFVLISFYGLGKNDWLPAGQLLNLGALLFVLPYFLFSAISGQLATRFNKARLAQISKILEVAIMLLAAYGFHIANAPLLLLCLFLMGSQSTLFGPVKYAILPEYLKNKELMMGNGLIESGTFLAILLGQITGTLLASSSMNTVSIMVLFIAILGLCSSLFMPSRSAAQADTQVEINIIKSTRNLLKETAAQKNLMTAIIGISWFWLVGAVYTTQLPTFVQLHLGGNDQVFNLMLALFSIGIATGSVLCAKLSKGQLKLFWVVIGALGLSILGFILVLLTQNTVHTTNQLSGIGEFLLQTQAYPIMALIAGIGFFGGFFSVPLYTWLQTTSSDAFRARAVAANNIFNGLFMVFAAISSAILLWISDSITLLYLIVAIGNLPLLLLLFWRCPNLLKIGKQTQNLPEN